MKRHQEKRFVCPTYSPITPRSLVRRRWVFLSFQAPKTFVEGSKQEELSIFSSPGVYGKR